MVIAEICLIPTSLFSTTIAKVLSASQGIADGSDHKSQYDSLQTGEIKLL